MLQPRRSGVRTALAVAFALSAPIAAQKHADEAAAQRAAFLSSPAWQTFLDAAGGEWSVQWCAATGTPGAIWGSGLPLADWRENSLAEARRHAHQLLRQHADLLGLGASEFREAIGARMHRVWTFTFDQHFRGLPVLGGRADVRVHMVGRVPMFGAKAVPVPADFAVLPSFDADTALAIAWQQVGAPTGAPQPARVKAPRLVIWSDVEAATPQAPRLCWEVAVSNVDAEGRGPIGRHLVDATSGALVRFLDDKHECGFDGCTAAAHGGEALPAGAAAMPPVNTTVTVQGWTRTGVDAFSTLTNAPLPGLQLNVPGVGAVTTDGNGQFTINIAAPVSIAVGALDGRHHGAIAGPDAPSGAFTVNPGVNTTIQLLTAAATTNEAAHTTTAYWTDKVNEYARGILGNTPELATASNIGVTVNIASTCNAYYTGNTMNFYQAGGGCSNTANATVVAHEWGHGIDERFGGISQTDGLSEGWGDTLGMYLCDTPNLGSGFQTPNSPLRSGNNATQYPCSGCGVHTAGQSWMGFAWKLRDRLAITLGARAASIALTNDIVVSTLAANATNQADALREVYVADDNDGNLANGTPNKPDLDWAANQHSLPIPGAGGGGGGGGPTNNECATAIAIGNGVSGPYSTVGATTSAPGWPCAAGGNDVWFTYTAYQAGTLTVTTCNLATWDTAIEIFAGDCATLASVGCIDDSCGLQSTLTVPVSPGVYSIRVGGYAGATGSFQLDVNGPTFVPAAVTAYGAGCYSLSKAFYEEFAPGAFDLASSAMRLAFDPAGFYVASAAGSYVPPTSSATTLALGDDTATTVTLATPMPYPGGTTAQLEVCSNGFVSPTGGNGANFIPSAAAWLGSPAARWGCWHDWNPAAGGSGGVKFEQIGATSYVTWDGVYSYGTTSPGTFQLQFHRPTGNVTFAWGPVAVAGNGWLVGFAAAQPNADLGSRDLSATLPGTFATSALNLLPLTLASTLPTLGSTLTLTTTNFTASTPVGIQVLGTTGLDPGVDLAALGMPGCFQYAAPTVLNTVAVAAGAAAFTLPIPNNPALMGFQMFAQSAGFAPGVNTAGLVTSNGVALTIGV